MVSKSFDTDQKYELSHTVLFTSTASRSDFLAWSRIIMFPKKDPFTSMLLTAVEDGSSIDVGDTICWWQVLDWRFGH